MTSRGKWPMAVRSQLTAQVLRLKPPGQDLTHHEVIRHLSAQKPDGGPITRELKVILGEGLCAAALRAEVIDLPRQKNEAQPTMS